MAIQHKINIRDTSKNNRVLIADSGIAYLANKPEGSVTEDEVKTLLRRYNVRDGLLFFGKTSNFVFNASDENKIGKAGYRDPETGVFITQFGLAYLANMLIISGSNDYKSKQVEDKENILSLSNMHSNCIEFPEIKKDSSGQINIISLFVQMHGEQFEFQFDGVLLIARTIVIYTKIINNVLPSKFEPLADVFKKTTGLSLDEYFFLSLAVWSSGNAKVAFRKEYLTEAKIPQLQRYLTDEKVSLFLNMISADYSTFRSEDEKMNENLLPINTKYRFNPLFTYPIIKTKREDNAPYIMPNTICFVKRAFGGLYWWFERYFKNLEQHLDFRTYFGSVFELYVGVILKQIFGDKNVHPEIIYKNGKFIDWWVEKSGKIYLFEAKAYQFALPTKQTGDYEMVVEEIKKKVAQTIRQVYKRIYEIDSVNELALFRKKKLIPIIVFLELPFISSNIYKEIITKELEKIESDENLKGLSKMKIYLLNIEELELYADVSKKIELEDVFLKYENNSGEGFLSILSKEKSSRLINPYLYKVYDSHWKNLLGKK